MKTTTPLRLCSLTRIGACALLVSLSLPTLAADWPQWRGPQRDGHSTETGLLAEWPSEGPQLLWHATAIGDGYSTPSIVGDRIYLLSNEGLDNEFALALATQDGRRLWATKLGAVGNPKQDPNYPAARSTPTVDGERLYALGSDGDLVCLETATGKLRWRKQLRADFGGQPGVWAYAESPLVDGETLVCTPGGSNATMIALNKLTGDVLWKCALPEADDASYACPILFETEGVRQYVQFLAKGLVGVEAKSGKLLWRYERSAKGSPAVILTPLADAGYIYSGAFRAGGALVRPVKSGNTFTVEEIYFNNKLPIGLGGVVKVGDYFFGSGSQSVMCAAFRSGAVQWEERGLGPCSWLVAEDRLYVHAENGDVALLEASAAGYRERGRFTPPNRPTPSGQSKAWAYPTLADGRLYIREWTSLWCYAVKRP